MIRVRLVSEAFISKFALPWDFGWTAAARGLEMFCSLVVGVILDAIVLGLFIFAVVTALLALSI